MSELKKLELPYGLEKIAPGVFSHCYALEKLFIPETVVEIGVGQFEFAKKVVIYSLANCYAEHYFFSHYSGVATQTRTDTYRC